MDKPAFSPSTMKKCGTCKEHKPHHEFHRNKRKHDGLATYCKPCAKIRNREYYLATPERNPQRRASHERARDAARRFVWDHLMTHPCVDCGNDNPIVLEFDHVRGEKTTEVSNMVLRGLGIDTIAAEVEKCDVRCANCHRIVTSLRGDWYAGPIIPL